MAFTSVAHRTKLAVLVKEGKVTQAEYDRHEAETPHGLPERAAPKAPKVKSLLRRKHK